MRWQPTHTRTLLILTALAIASATATHFIRHQPDTHLIVPVAEENRAYDSYTSVKLAFKEFRPATNQFTGAVQIEVAPQWERIKPEDRETWPSRFTLGFLRFGHYDGKTDVFQGGADKPIPIAVPPLWSSLEGYGTFTWNSVPQSSAFYYPFDRYTLYVKPELFSLKDPDDGLYPNRPVDLLEADFANSNFVPERHRLNVAAKDYLADRWEITLQRPALLRTLAIVVGILLIVWLIYLIWAAKPGENAGQIVTLFVGVFSIRSSLLSGAPVFPSFIDYCALAVYLSAALIVLIKWLIPDRNTQTCPHCKSTINNQATICPQCTRPVKEAPAISPL